MSAALLSPAPVTAEAHAVLHMALDAVAAWPAGGKAREAVFSAVVVLGCALCGCRQHGGEDKAAKAASELIRVMSEHCGPGWGEAL
jgi:hypothetical protein